VARNRGPRRPRAASGGGTLIRNTYSNTATIALQRNNVFVGTATATANKGTGVFTPPYPYTADDASTVQAAVMAGAGPH
jgi:hypothetical protein